MKSLRTVIIMGEWIVVLPCLIFYRKTLFQIITLLLLCTHRMLTLPRSKGQGKIRGLHFFLPLGIFVDICHMLGNKTKLVSVALIGKKNEVTLKYRIYTALKW